MNVIVGMSIMEEVVKLCLTVWKGLFKFLLEWLNALVDVQNAVKLQLAMFVQMACI